MTLKTDLLGWLLNAQLLTALCGMALPRRWSRWVWPALTLLAAFAVGVRWAALGTIPLQTLFDAFLWLPLLLGLCGGWSALKAKDGTERWDAGLAAVILFPLAFVFTAHQNPLPPALQSPYFIPHVLGYLVAYVLLTRACILEWHGRTESSRSSLRWGFLFLTVAFVLGSLWGYACWGSYWQWDPKEVSALLMWLIYGILFFTDSHRGWRRWLLSLGVLAIVLTVTWINLSTLFSGMHRYAGF